MGARSFDAEIVQVPSQDCADRYFAPNIIMHRVFIYVAILTGTEAGDVLKLSCVAISIENIPHVYVGYQLSARNNSSCFLRQLVTAT